MTEGAVQITTKSQDLAQHAKECSRSGCGFAWEGQAWRVLKVTANPILSSEPSYFEPDIECTYSGTVLVIELTQENEQSNGQGTGEQL